MKQLIIIGNGFDLACGLDSKYIDFFNAKIKDGIDFKKNKDLKDFWQKLLYGYQENYKDFENYNWCDIEKIIHKTLHLINFGNDSFFKEAWEFAVSRFENSYKEEDTIKRFILRYCANYLSQQFDYEIEYNNIVTSLEQKRNKFNEHLFNELKNLEKSFANI